MAIGKSELVDYVASKMSSSKGEAQKAVEVVLSGIADSLKKGEEVKLIGFGSFSIVTSAARDGKHPRTGETIQIAASKRPTFKAGKDLKVAMNRCSLSRTKVC